LGGEWSARKDPRYRIATKKRRLHEGPPFSLVG
jgi:hypothetical protein